MIETQLPGIMGYVKQISASNDLLGGAHPVIPPNLYSAFMSIIFIAWGPHAGS